MSGHRSESESSPQDEQIEVEVVELEPTLRGYHVTWNYGIRYWLPFLGPIPWCVWQTLLSFCYGDRDTCWPSISLIADIATGGNRNLITGRWRGRGSNRRRQPGALDTLQDAGLISIRTAETGRALRYTFHVLREPPLLAPDQLAQLSPRLQQLHADLLARCNIDQETYQERVRSFRSLAALGSTPSPEDDAAAAQDTTTAALDTRPAAQDTIPAAPDSTNNYNEELQIEEIWIRIKEALKLQINDSNYEWYVQDTHAVSFDRRSNTLTVEARDELVADHLNRYFTRSLRWAIADAKPSIGGICIYGVKFIPSPHRPSLDIEHDHHEE
jgi:hypothetical protein